MENVSDRNCLDATSGPSISSNERWPVAAYQGPASLSPGLVAQHQTSSPAYEVKFLIDDVTRSELVAFLSRWLAPDPHGTSADNGGYEVTTLYTDTPDGDVYFRKGRFARVKYRLRGYGSSSHAFLECKRKRNQAVRKQRVAIDRAAVGKLVESDGHSAATSWFTERIRRHSLQPVCLVSYRRQAYFGASMDGPIRLTLDRDVRGGLINGWSLDCPRTRPITIDNAFIGEFKFCGAMPAIFKQAVARWRLDVQSISKYRRAVDTLSIDAVRLFGSSTRGGPCRTG